MIKLVPDFRRASYFSGEFCEAQSVHASLSMTVQGDPAVIRHRCVDLRIIPEFMLELVPRDVTVRGLFRCGGQLVVRQSLAERQADDQGCYDDRGQCRLR